MRDTDRHEESLVEGHWPRAPLGVPLSAPVADFPLELELRLRVLTVRSEAPPVQLGVVPAVNRARPGPILADFRSFMFIISFGVMLRKGGSKTSSNGTSTRPAGSLGRAPESFPSAAPVASAGLSG